MFGSMSPFTAIFIEFVILWVAIMIGCEIRTYMRLGLGYATAVAAFPGFLLGYLPYTLFAQWWEDLASATVITEATSVPELFGQAPSTQLLVALLDGLVLGGLVVWSVGRGMRLTGTSFKALATTPNDELAIDFHKRNFPKDQGAYAEHVKQEDVLV